MYVKPCPLCGRLPKISEGRARNGHRFYSIGCPNYCWALRPDPTDWYNSRSFNRSRLYINEDIDYNVMYKKWNEELIEHD